MESSAVILVSGRTQFEEVVQETSFVSPVLLLFWVEWCKVSTVLKTVLEGLAAEFRGAFSLAVVPCHLEDLQDKKEEFKGKERPHVVLLKDGSQVASFSGGLPRHKVLQFLHLHDIFA